MNILVRQVVNSAHRTEVEKHSESVVTRASMKESHLRFTNQLSQTTNSCWLNTSLVVYSVDKVNLHDYDDDC